MTALLTSLAGSELPANLYALLGVAIIAGAGVATALGTAYFQNRVGKKVDEVHGTVSNVQKQVVNGHDTNLRDDITKIDDAVGVLSEHVLLMRKDMTAHQAYVSEEFKELNGRMERFENGRDTASAS